MLMSEACAEEGQDPKAVMTVSMTEKKLNNYLQQARFLMNVDKSKVKGSGSSTKLKIKNFSIDHHDPFESSSQRNNPD